MHTFISFLLTADISQTNTPAYQALQRKWMLNFFGGEEKYNEPIFERHICEWEGVECADSIVTTVNTTRVFITLHLFIQFLPHTVRFLNIASQRVDVQLETRLLPRSLEAGNFDSTGLYGTVNLQTLPEKVVGLSFQSNRICGPIYVGFMPASIRRINFQCNPIRRVYVQNSHLPEGLEQVLFCRLKGGRHVSMLSLDGEAIDPRVAYYPLA